MAILIEKAGSECWRLKMRQGASTAGLAMAMPKGGIGQVAAQGADEGLDVAGGDESASHAVDDGVDAPRNTAGQHGFAHGGGLQVSDAEAFAVAGVDQEIHDGEMFGDIVPPASQVDPWILTEDIFFFGHEGVDGFEDPDQKQVGVGKFLADLAPGAGQLAHALLTNHPTDEANDRSVEGNAITAAHFQLSIEAIGGRIETAFGVDAADAALTEHEDLPRRTESFADHVSAHGRTIAPDEMGVSAGQASGGVEQAFHGAGQGHLGQAENRQHAPSYAGQAGG